MKRILLAVAGLLVVVVAGLALYVTFADLSRFRPDVEAAVSQATGREFRITGEFKPKVLPRPSLVAEGVTLANANWGAPMPMLSVGRASVEVGLWSLVSGPIRIKNLELQDVSILLEQNASGASNWSSDAPAAPPPRTSSNPGLQELPAIIELASIGNVTVLLKRPEKDDLPSALAKLDLRTDERGVIVADGNGQVGETPFTLNATIARADDRRAQVDVQSSIADATVVLQALVGPRQVDFDAAVDGLSRLAEAFSVAGLPAGTLELDGSLIVGSDRYELRRTTARLLGVESKIEAVAPQRGDDPVEIDLEISAPDIASLRAGLPSLALTSTARARVSPERIEVDPFTIEVGDSDFSGSISAELGETVSLGVKGESKILDLRPFQGTTADEAAQDGAKAEKTATNVKADSKPKDGKWVFGEDELPFERIASTSIDAKVSVAELRSRDAEARNVELGLTSDGKSMRLATTFDAEGGSLEGNAVLAVADERADLDFELAAHDLRLNVASGEVDDPSEIPPIGLTAKLRSSGSSPRALASAANGRVVLTQGKGKIDNAAVGLVSGDIVAQVFSALNPFAKDEKHMNWECTVVALDVVDGVGTLGPMLAQAEKLMITGGGKVDLRTERLDIEFNTKPRSGVGITADMFVTPFVKVTGTLSEPGVGLNATGTLMSGGAAALTGGLSVLAKGLLDRATGERDQCAKALEEAGGASAPLAR
jgi:uncharacterized protein involved in outer membrane biogenesis